MSQPPFYPIIDGHNDTLLSLHLPERGQGRSFLEPSDHGHIDLPRARTGGLAGGFFAVFVPSDQCRTDESAGVYIPPSGEGPARPAIDAECARRFATAMTARLFRLEVESQGALRVVKDASTLQSCIDQGVLAAILHFEGAEAIDADLDALHVFHRAGLRSLGLVWSRPNIFAHGVPFTFGLSPDTGPGLTDAGRRLVKACNDLGIMLDVSHLNERGFWDLSELTEAPIIATHSAAHALCPSPRNLTDEQIDAIGNSGGLVGVVYHTGFTRADGKSDPETSLDVLIGHIDYMVERIGIDHVAFGSDFDGATMPERLRDAAHLPNLIEALREHGYDDAALNRLTHRNWIRVLERTWK